MNPSHDDPFLAAFTHLERDTDLALPAVDGLAPSFHRWDQREIDALQLARAADRPLLVRGEPGIGKTQLARAAAAAAKAKLHAITIDARTEPDDLIFRFDAVRRLADAQAGKPGSALDQYSYWEPGPIWRAFDWALATKYGSLRGSLEQPTSHVILLDEIDKAESDLPNSLLELLGQRSYTISALNKRLGGPDTAQPLIVITSNEERELPAAFLRRCIVLNLEAAGDYATWLVERGRSHFSGKEGSPVLDTRVLEEAAAQLADDRDRARTHGLHMPGAAEYLDLLHALACLEPDNTKGQGEALKRLSRYAFVKHATVDGQPDLGQHREPLGSAPQTSAAPSATAAASSKTRTNANTNTTTTKRAKK